MKKAIISIGIILFLTGVWQLWAADKQKTKETPVGIWKTIDDKTHDVTSKVQIWKSKEGALYGRIIQLYPEPDEDPDPVCDKCKGRYKDKKILGMVILWGFSQDEEDTERYWVKGKILDPDNGKIYSCKMTVNDGGKSLEVRGYVGISLLGRSQTWIRVR
ncbi:MAG: DUF2147 domain-containing protein [Leptospirales bacterium]